MRMRDRLRLCLSERGVSQKWLADRVGTTEATISRCLNGVNVPSGELIMAMADALDVSMDYLMGMTPIADRQTQSSGEKYIVGCCFTRCTQRDRDLILRILDEYMTDEEREHFKT